MIIIACRPSGRRLFVILTNPVTALLISRQDDDHRDDQLMINLFKIIKIRE